MAFMNLFEKSPDQFVKLVDRNDLWKILTLLAERRAIDQIRAESTLRSGGGRILNETALANPNDHGSPIDNFPTNRPPDDFEAILVEEVELRLDSLNDETLRRVAVERMEGHRNPEIAKKLQMSLRSVERKLTLIKDIFRSCTDG